MGTSITDNTALTDAELVAASLGGDRLALAAIYDRYTDRIHTMCVHMLGDRDEAADVCGEVFLVAFQRLGQLRDPERLRPWLYAICRHEVFRRTKRRNRTVLVEEVSEMDRIADHDDDVDTADPAMLARLVQEAAFGLDDRDRLVLELQLQGVDSDDLAAALGTSTSTSYQHVHRMRERMERSVGALLVARQGRRDCRDLDRLLADWDGGFSVLWRKRVARHVDGCDVCERRRKGVPAALFGTAGASPLVVTPTSVRTRVLDAAIVGTGSGASGRGGWRRDGFPPGPHDGRRRALTALAIAIALLVVAAASWAAFTDDPMSIATTDAAGATTTTSAPTSTSSAPVDDATTSAVSAPVTVPPAPPPAPTTAVPAPTTTVPLRSTTTVAPKVPNPATTTTTTSTSTTTTTTVAPPTLRLGGPSVVYARTRDGAACSNQSFTATITSAGVPDSVTLRWTAGAATGTVAMSRNRTRNVWSATVDLPFGTAGAVTVVAEAAAGGATGRSLTLTATSAPCPIIG